MLVGIVAAAAIPTLAALEQWSLARAGRLVEGHLAAARLHALAHRTSVRVREPRPFEIETVDAAGRVIARLRLPATGLRALDSVRIRPASIRFNARGHGGAGSVRLYDGHRGVRVVSNFVGRIRRSSFRY